jgi:hypothetical protein
MSTIQRRDIRVCAHQLPRALAATVEVGAFVMRRTDELIIQAAG